MSVAEILHEVRYGNISESDLDPQVIKAFHLQFPHVGNFVQDVYKRQGVDWEVAYEPPR